MPANDPAAVNAEILAAVIAKHGERPDGAPEHAIVAQTTEHLPPVDVAAAVGAPKTEDTQAGGTPEASVEPEVAPEPVKVAPAVDIEAIVSAAVAKALAAVAPAAPPPPPAPTFTEDRFRADPVAAMKAAGIDLEHVAAHMVAAQYPANQIPDSIRARTAVSPQIAQLTGTVSALTASIASLQSQARQDSYLRDLERDFERATAERYPLLAAARGVDRDDTFGDVRSELSAMAKFSDPSAPAPKTADVLAAVEKRLARYDRLTAAPAPAKQPPVSPPALKAPKSVMPSNLGGSPAPATLSLAEQERLIGEEVVRKYSNPN